MTTTPISELVPKNSPFPDYYAEFTDIMTSAQRTLSIAQESATKSDSDRAIEHLSSSRRYLEEASELLNSLEMELQTLAPKVRTSLRPYVLSSRESLSRNRSTVRAIQLDIDSLDDSNARVRLLADGAESERIRVTDATSDIEAASKSIVDSRRNITETEVVGTSILNDLRAQRETIVRTRTNLGAVDDGIDHSSSILSSMQRRAIVNRIIIYVVGAFIFIACIAVLYIRLFHPNQRKQIPMNSNTP